MPAGAARSDQGRVAVDTVCKLCPARSAAPRIARRRVCYSLFSCLIISFFVQVIIRFCRRKNGSMAMLHERFLFSGANVSRDASLNLNFVQFQCIENIPSGQSSAKLPVTRSLGHLVIRFTWSLGHSILGHSVFWSLGHSVTQSLSHSFTRSLGHLVIRSLGNMVTWSHGHLVTQSLSH